MAWLSNNARWPSLAWSIIELSRTYWINSATFAHNIEVLASPPAADSTIKAAAAAVEEGRGGLNAFKALLKTSWAERIKSSERESEQVNMVWSQKI